MGSNKPADHAAIIAMVHGGWKDTQIARYFGICATTVLKHRRQAGIATTRAKAEWSMQTAAATGDRLFDIAMGERRFADETRLRTSKTLPRAIDHRSGQSSYSGCAAAMCAG